MLSFFRKKKTIGTVPENRVQEKLAMKLVVTCIRWQQRWAAFMGRHTERLSHKGKLVAFSTFCLVSGSQSIHLVVNSLTNRKASTFTITQLTDFSTSGKSGDEATKILEIISKREYESMQRFQCYMDSLAGSPSGKKVYDSILLNRPGLIDSLLFLQKIYQSKNKK